MGYLVYRENTHQYFAGYDSVDRPVWVAVDDMGSAIKYADYDDANIEADKLWHKGFVINIHLLGEERIQYDW